MKQLALMLFAALATGCANSPAATSYCDATSSRQPTRELAVRDVYVYGTREHGSMLISPLCIRPLYNFYSFQESVSSAAGAADRIRLFNRAVYNSPAKASGLFKLRGVVNVHPESTKVELYDVLEFHEVDEGEARPIIQMVRRTRQPS